MARTVYLMTAYQPAEHPSLSLQLDDRWFVFSPLEPVEIDTEFDANKLLEIYGTVYGLVEVPVNRTRTGTSIDIAAAEVLARKELDRSEKVLLDAYVRDQRENRVRHNFPALPPSGRVADIVASRNIDLKAKYNLDIVGAEAIAPTASAREQALAEENANLRTRLDATDDKLNQLLELMTAQQASSASAPPAAKGGK